MLSRRYLSSMLTVTERTTAPLPDHPSQSATADLPAPTPLERLRQLIEAAPAAVIVTSSEGAVLAANGDAAALLGIDQRDQLIGSTLADRVANEDRERFRRFVDQVCAGQPGTLEYRLADAGDRMPWVETRAVPLARDAGSRPVFLSVTWDVTERRRTADSERRQARSRLELVEAQLVAQREAYEAALQDARTAGDRIKQNMAAKRKTLSATIRRARTRFQARLAETGLRHEQAAADAQAERESLTAKLQNVEDRRAEQAAENERLVAALNETRMRLSNLDEERNEERAQRHALLDQRERWRVKLSEVLEAMSQNPAPPTSGESQWEF
jgi:PAS domain S-box-containing protein